jgi:hypothetical protein
MNVYGTQLYCKNKTKLWESTLAMSDFLNRSCNYELTGYRSLETGIEHVIIIPYIPQEHSQIYLGTTLEMTISKA